MQNLLCFSRKKRKNAGPPSERAISLVLKIATKGDYVFRERERRDRERGRKRGEVREEREEREKERETLHK